MPKIVTGFALDLPNGWIIPIQLDLQNLGSESQCYKNIFPATIIELQNILDNKHFL